MPTLTPRIRFVIFATAWGSTHGGINSFNMDFVSALAAVLGEQIACVVPGASEAERESAKRAGVMLLALGLEAREQFDMGSVHTVLGLADFSKVEYWIGHDIITGEFAAKVQNTFKRGRLATITHQSYQDYGPVKHPTGKSDKARRQKELFTSADEVFAVGPLLHTLLLDWSGKAKLIIPGLRVVHHRPAENALRVAVFGRLTRDNTLMKGIELAGHAVAQAVKTARAARGKSIAEYTLIKFIGGESSDTYASEIKRGLQKRAGRPLNVSSLPFLPIPELLKEIDGVNLCLMLSWHEGFGLTGWEAIGAGIPLILGRNSGVYKLLEDVGGRAKGCVRSIDVSGSLDLGQPFQKRDLEAASAAVLEIAGDIQRAIADADDLRNLLVQRGYTWEAAAKNFIEVLTQDSPVLRQAEQASNEEKVIRRPIPRPRAEHDKTHRRISKTGVRNDIGTLDSLAKIHSATPQSSFSVGEMVAAGGLTAFYPSREYYAVYRSVSSIDAYVSTARRSIVMVSINLMTGVPFDGLCEALKSKLESADDFSVLISLLDPTKPWLMQSLGPVLDREPEALADSIFESLNKLWKMKQELPAAIRPRLSIRVHHAIPFGSAILLDHAGTDGRIQIETKVYRVAVRKSFAFEVAPSGSSGFYNTLVSGYLNLIDEGREVDADLLRLAKTVPAAQR